MQIENMEMGYVNIDISINMRKHGIKVNDALRKKYKEILTINLLQEQFHANFDGMYIDNSGFGCQLYFEDILNEVFIPFNSIFLIYDKYSNVKIEMFNNLKCHIENIDNIASLYKKENISVDNTTKNKAHIINFDDIKKHYE